MLNPDICLARKTSLPSKRIVGCFFFVVVFLHVLAESGWYLFAVNESNTNYANKLTHISHYTVAMKYTVADSRLNRQYLFGFLTTYTHIKNHPHISLFAETVLLANRAYFARGQTNKKEAGALYSKLRDLSTINPH